MVWAKPEIFKAIRNGKIRIEPYDAKLVGSCSVDFRLGNHFKRIKKSKKPVLVSGNPQYDDHLHEEIVISDGKFIQLKPGELVLGVTYEKLTLDNKTCAFIEGRSRLARLGLLVHVSSGMIQPGVSNHQVLEIVNLSPHTLHLQPKTIICQILFNDLKGKAEYKGEFKNQTTA
ncbi:dCTP deaminase [Candidatus Micrarchaeota archaeon]|nr:dCTP deaminase [Candidatus Micrarchaeota archaeon]